MAQTERDALAARVAVQAIALQELMRALAPAQAAQVDAALRTRVEAIFGTQVVSPDVDAAVAGELALLLGAINLK